MNIPPDLKKIITAYEQSGFPPYSSLTASVLRQKFNEAFAKKPPPPTVEMATIIDHHINEQVKIKCYYPSKTNRLPALMYFHGGGFVIRDKMAVYDHSCRLIAKQLNCVVIAVDYRLAPEYPFPAAVEDCYQASCWVLAHHQQLAIDPKRFGVWGESCGGNLAAVISMMCRDKKQPGICCQIIVSPMLAIDFNRPSYQHYSHGYILTTDTMRWFWQHYLKQESDKTNPYALPVHAKNFNNLPPALIATSEYDVLKDDGKHYSEQLKNSNTCVDYQCYPQLIHGFFDLYHQLDSAKRSCDAIMARAKKMLNA